MPDSVYSKRSTTGGGVTLVDVTPRDENWSVYRSKACVRALRMNEPFQINSVVDDETFSVTGKPGDFIVEDENGRLHVVDGPTFDITHYQQG